MDETIDIPSGKPPRYFRWQRHWCDLIAAHHSLHGLVDSNLPLAEGLLQLSQDAPRRSLRYTFYWLHRDLSEGNALYRAMGNQPNIFPHFCVDMIRAGEESGDLEGALANLLRELDSSFQFRREVAGNGMYLTNLLVYEAVIILGLAKFVLPQFQQIWGSFGRDLVPPMGFLISMQGFWICALALLSLPVLWLAWQYSVLRNGFLRDCFLRVESVFPMSRMRHIKRYMADACTMISMLTGAGIALHVALRSAAEATPSVLCQRVLYRIADRLEEGESLRDSLDIERRVVPRSMRSLLGLAEASGHVPEGFRQIADLYQIQARRGAHLLLEIGAPLVLCAMGGLVFIWYSAVFFSVIDLSVMVTDVAVSGP
ncbi:MAG: type II secretion system F family protein [Candidatus Hydrogenedentes bacterium]|nr:type II secretion system F family protein [Candidatus Hydrogenedentota bacterium]